MQCFLPAFVAVYMWKYTFEKWTMYANSLTNILRTCADLLEHALSQALT